MAADEEMADAAPTPTEGSEAGDVVEKPKKKKTSVKVVKRVSKKKVSEKDSPADNPPPIQEQENVAPPEASEPPSKSESSSSIAAPAIKEPEPAPVVRRPSSKRRMQRSGSNVFAMFTQNQVHQFKEAFSFIDQDKDGIISKNDIRSTFDALGRLISEDDLTKMTKEAPGPINFTMFLTVFGDRVQGTDEEDVVLQAFSRYDEGDGFCSEDK